MLIKIGVQIQGIEVNGASKHFMAFGGGMRFCVGTDFTKVQMAVFLHCLVTKYRYTGYESLLWISFPDYARRVSIHAQTRERES